MLSIQQQKIEIAKNVLDDFQAYIVLSESKQVNIKYEVDGEVIITIGSNISHQFSITISEDCIKQVGKKSKNKNIELIINGEFLSKIFAVIDFDKENKPLLYIANQKPIVIQDGKTIWAIAPLIEEE